MGRWEPSDLERLYRGLRGYLRRVGSGLTGAECNDSMTAVAVIAPRLLWRADGAADLFGCAAVDAEVSPVAFVDEKVVPVALWAHIRQVAVCSGLAAVWLKAVDVVEDVELSHQPASSARRASTTAAICSSRATF